MQLCHFREILREYYSTMINNYIGRKIENYVLENN